MPSHRDRLARHLWSNDRDDIETFLDNDTRGPLTWLETATAVFVGVLAALIAATILSALLGGVVINALLQMT